MKERRFGIQSVHCLLLVMLPCVLLLAGCSKKDSIPDITYTDIVEANRSLVLLKNHSSISAITTEGSDAATAMDIYIDSSTIAIDYADYQLIYTPQIQGTLEKGVFTPMLNMSDKDLYQQAQENLLIEPSESELVTDCVRNGDTLTVTTALAADESKRIIETTLGETAENDSLSAEYCVDADGYALQSYALYLNRDGEQRQLQSIDKIVYDVEAPAFIAEALELAAKPQTLAEGDARTVSVVIDPDTSGEKTISLTVAKGNGVFFIYREGYSTLYWDRDCTVIYTEGTADKNENLTLYCIPDKESTH